jgi:hypothetical protein
MKIFYKPSSDESHGLSLIMQIPPVLPKCFLVFSKYLTNAKL